MRRTTISALFVLFTINLSAQTLTVKLWKQGAPGAKIDTSYKETTVLDKNRPRISKVTDPEIQVYLPDRSVANGTAVVICPGGGYGRLAIDHEGWDVAKWFNSIGVAGIVLKYRLPSNAIMVDKTIGPLQDVQEAIRLVRRNAKEWNINPNQIGVMGFSAGGHLAGTATTLYNEKVYTPSDTVNARPNFSILIYGVLSMQSITHSGSKKNLLGDNPSQELIDKFSNELHINTSTPPAFIVHSQDDKSVPVENSIRYYQALVKNGIPAELHIYEKGGHGYGMALDRKSTESTWTEACVKWLKSRGLL
jgi:acetyl esterase/lipase